MKRDVAAKQVASDLYINENMPPRWISEFSADSLVRFELSPKLSTSQRLHQGLCIFCCNCYKHIRSINIYGSGHQVIQASSPVWLLKFDIGFLD